MRNQVIANENERRKLHDFLQKMRGNIRVFCRLKALNDISTRILKFDKLKDHKTWSSIHTLELNSDNSSNKYYFDNIFINSSQQDVSYFIIKRYSKR